MRRCLGLFAAVWASAACSAATGASREGGAGLTDVAGRDAGPDATLVRDASSDTTVAEPGLVVAATVSVTPATTLKPLPDGVVGLSYEKSDVAKGIFNANNAALVSMFRLLGPCTLRVGGNSADETTWYTAAAPDAGASTVITEADVDALAAFAQSAGWSVLYGLNMKTSNPALAAAEAAYAAGALGTNLYAFEIGNEVDEYTSTALSPTWSYPTFTTQWAAFDDAIQSVFSAGAPMSGPASASHYATWTVPFAADEGSSIRILTQHYYRGDGRSPTATMDELLQPDPNLAVELQALSAATGGQNSVSHYRISECNSYANGGAPGVSDAFGSALWAIDFLFANALNGSRGTNFHGGGTSPGYTPIADDNGTVIGARPLFYGLLFFTRIGAGTIVATSTKLATNLNFSAYAVLAKSGGAMNVVLVNKDPNATVHATIDAGEAIASATSILLEGGTLDATSGVTLAGASIDPTGAWAPNAPAALAVAANNITVDVPPASAALVTAVTP